MNKFLGIVNLAYGLSIIPPCRLDEKQVADLVVDGITYSVRCATTRLLLFKRSITCVNCKVRGAYWVLERNYNTNNLKLYTADHWEMTVDHIYPKSLGGKLKRLTNLQVMCEKCNQTKQSNVTEQTAHQLFLASKREMEAEQYIRNWQHHKPVPLVMEEL